jgi:Fur family ferric uptake transcriptional regulator
VEGTQDLVQALRDCGFRVTPQRAVILQTVAAFSGHITAQEVYEAAQKRLPGLNLATVYRTLESLQQAGLIDLFLPGTSQARFSLRDPDHPHCHLVCTGCRQEYELPASWAQRLSAEVRAQLGFEIDASHLTLTGLCRKCAGSDQSRSG